MALSRAAQRYSHTEIELCVVLCVRGDRVCVGGGGQVRFWNVALNGLESAGNVTAPAETCSHRCVSDKSRSMAWRRGHF
jgi:hypothetical protein